MRFNSGFKGLNKSDLSTKRTVWAPNNGLELHVPVIEGCIFIVMTIYSHCMFMYDYPD